MKLKTLVKVGNISNLTDARYSAGMGVDMIGFSLDEDDPAYLTIDEINAITGWISGVKLVGETKEFNIEKINFLIKELNLDYIQLNSSFNFDKYAQINKPIIQKVLVLDSYVLHLYLNKVEYMLFESVDPNFDIMKVREQLKAFSTIYPIIVGSGLNPENINYILEECHIKGIALKGSMEDRPGSKDYDDLADILEVIQDETF
jgi:phosphoribosylanthranilate isomerase